MNRLYKRTDLMILQWVMHEEQRRQKGLKTKDFTAAAKNIPTYHVSLYRRPDAL